jgi:hypothetical protein
MLVKWLENGCPGSSMWRWMLLNCCWYCYWITYSDCRSLLIDLLDKSLPIGPFLTQCVKSRPLNKWSPHKCKNRFKGPCTAHNLRGLCEACTLRSGLPQSQAKSIKRWQHSQYSQKGFNQEMSRIASLSGAMECRYHLCDSIPDRAIWLKFGQQTVDFKDW